VPEPVEVAEKISVNGRCEEVIRRVGVDEVAARRKLVHRRANKNRLRLWRKIVVDEDEVVVVDGDL
jgi:hypothetical protein